MIVVVMVVVVMMIMIMVVVMMEPDIVGVWIRSDCLNVCILLVDSSVQSGLTVTVVTLTWGQLG